MFVSGWKFENGNIYCLKRKHEVIVALTHVQCLPVYWKMYTLFLEEVHF